VIVHRGWTCNGTKIRPGSSNPDRIAFRSNNEDGQNHMADQDAPTRGDHHGRQWTLGAGARTSPVSSATTRARGGSRISSAPARISGVEYLTIFAFSTENWKRTQTEVAGLMKLFKRYIRREAASLFEENVRVRFIGDRVRLEPALVDLMDGLELMTAGNSGTNLTIALNYGGRDEVARAARRLAHDVAAGRLDPRAISHETFPRYLDTYVLPDPDLVIRTSGEARISNFLLWQSAYAEYEFVDTLWPDFTPGGIRACPRPLR
jgi:undecaprenyl diphosphate synthase